MDVLMPDGTLVTDVPEGVTQSQLLARYSKFSATKPVKEAPTLSPEEQVMGSIGAPGEGIASIFTKPSKPQPIAEPTLSPEEQVMGAIGAPSDELTKMVAAPQGRVNAEGQITSMTRDQYVEELRKRGEQTPERTAKSTAIDAGVTALKAAIGLPESFVGLANIPTMGYAGKILKDMGYNPGEAKAILDTYLSEAQQVANRKVSEAEGFFPTVGAALQNPSVIASSVAESLPQMLGGVGIAKGVLKAAPSLSPLLAAAVGEGALGAGSAAEQIRQQSKDELLSGKQVLSALGSGVGTAVFSIAGGKFANKLGVSDIDTLLVAGSSKFGAKSVADFAKKATLSGVSEGFFEEMPQSAQEQMWMNYATDKPILEGVPEAAGMGFVTGSVMGGAATALSGRKQTPQEERAQAFADALTTGAAGATVDQTSLDELVRKSLSPESGIQAGTNIRAQTPMVGEIAPPVAAPIIPAEPVAAAAPIAPPADLLAGPAAAPSESMDTEAMLREVLGEQPKAAPVAPVAPAAPVVAPVAPVVTQPTVDLIAESAKYDTPDLRLNQSDSLGDNVMGLVYSEMESHGRAALKNKSLTEGYAKKKDAMADAIDAATVAFGTNDYSVFQPYATLFPKTAARLQTHFEEATPAEVKPAEVPVAVAPVAPTVTPVTEAAPVEAKAKTEEDYRKDWRNGQMSINAVRENRITQEQYENYQAAAEVARQELDKLQSQQAAAASPAQQEAIKIAEQMEALGEKNVSSGIRGAARRPSVERNLPFYREKLQELTAQKGKAEAVKEGFNWQEFLKPGEQKYYGAFQEAAPQQAKDAFTNVTNAILDVTDAANNLGYKINDIKGNASLDARQLKSQYTNLLSDGLKLLSSHYAIQNEYKRANPEKFDLLVASVQDSARTAQQAIRKAVPKPEEVAGAEQRITEGERAVSKLKTGSKLSLWNALTGALGQGDMVEMFSRNIPLYAKKLQVKKGSGTSIADLTASGALDEFLPYQMRHTSQVFDNQESEEYIKEQVRSQNYISYDVQQEIEQIFGSVEDAESIVNEYLTTEEQNLELEKAADEQRQSEIAARGLEPESEIPAVEPAEGEALAYTTPEGLKAAEERRKKIQAEEAKAEKEAAAKAKADEEVGGFTLTGSNRAADVAAAQGQKDIFAQEEEPAKEEGVKVVPFEADSTVVGEILKETKPEDNPFDIRFNALMHPDKKPARPKPTEFITAKEAKAQLEEWKAEVARQGKTNKNRDRTIMSLFDASGEWSKPWREAGYNVWTFDIQSGEDINDFSAEFLLNEGFGDMDIWGILAAPPCTDYSSSGAQYWAKKDAKGQTELSNELVRQTLRTIEFLQPKIWALENPIGRIAKLHNLPPAHLSFDPNFYGDPYTKKTLLWGNFENDLPMAPVEATEGSRIINLSGKDKYARSLTPEGFAYAFFMANNAEGMTPAERLERTYFGVDPKAFEGATKEDEQAIKDSEDPAFEDTYYDGELQEAADIARGIISGEPVEAEAVEAPAEEALSLEYKDALKESREATADFKEVQQAYRANKIGDKEFLAGKKNYEVAMAKFDEAFEKEQEARPTGEIEVLDAEEKPEAVKLSHEPYTIEGDFTEIGEEKQHLLLADQSSKLTEDQNKTLESQYGAKRDTAEFLDGLRKDVIAFITQGAQAVNGKIRAIIRRVANGILAVAIVFNPQFVSKPYTIAIPQYDITTSEVIKDLPKEAKTMSDAAKRAYGVIYPALEKQLKENDKLFIVADKQSGNTYMFNPDGSLLLQSKTLFGLAIGDYMSGDNEIEANRITPAGVFDLGLRDAKRSAGEAYTAGDYDFGKVFVLDKAHMGSNGPYSNTIMHSVWTHETDAKQRLAALNKPGAEDSRYSFGCINVNKETFKYLITNHLSQIDGAKIFIVPENGTNVMDFINGKAMTSDDIIRQRVEPVTKTTVTERQVPAPKPGVERKLVGREEVAKAEVKTEATPEKSPGEPEDQNFYSITSYGTEEEKKRSPSLKREIKQLNKERNDGRLTVEQFIERVDSAVKADEQIRKPRQARVRGADYIRQRLLEAKRRGDISEKASDMAEWFISKNPELVEDLAVGVRAPGQRGVAGFYNTVARLMVLAKDHSSDDTTVHEILHHFERMMPEPIRTAIRSAWGSQIAKATKKSKTEEELLFFLALTDFNFGNNTFEEIKIPDGLEGAFKKLFNKAIQADVNVSKSSEVAKFMIQSSQVPEDHYQYFDPSEFWAVNGSRIVEGRFDAVQGGALTQLKSWLKELVQKLKSIFGLESDAVIIRALDSLAKGDGKFVTDQMLSKGEYHQAIRNYKGNAAPTALWDAPQPSFMDGITYQLADKQIDTKRVVDEIRKTTGQIDERLDAYTKESLYSSKSAAQIEDFLKDKFTPLFEQMRALGVTVDEMETYLHNRHAEERNEQINKINLAPDIQDIGSGISTDDAQKYLAGLPAAQKAKLQSLAAKVDGIIEGTQKLLVDSGLETKETVDTWNKTYKHYIPLQRDDLDFVHTGSGYVGGVGTKGTSSRRAVGSIKPVKDILANIAIQRERAIRRSEQAVVGRALYALAITSPNPGFWLPVNPNAIKNKAKLVQEMVSLGLTIQDAENLIQEPKVPVIDKATGLVKYQVNPSLRGSDNVFPVRINGEDRFIIFNPKDERAMRMARSLKNLDADELGWFLGNMGAVTRWIASVNTQYNPVFGAWNMTRDVWSAALNLSTTEIAGKEKEVLKGTMPAMFAIWTQFRGKPAKNAEQQEWMDLFEQMRLAGGTTGFAKQFSGQTEGFGNFMERMKTGKPKEKVNIVEQELKKLNAGNARKASDAVFKWLSDYNDTMENAVRVSAFKVALKEGHSEQKAASIAKELTVNFNRKGASSPTLQALYAFINASIQASTRLTKTLKGPMGKKIIAGGITLGVIQALALALNGYDDGDPPDFLKDKNFIIPIPFAGKNYVIIPMPLGYNVFPGIGRILTEAALIQMGLLKSNKGLGDKVAGIGLLVLDAFNPLGAGSFTQMLTPTALDPFFALKANVDAFGRPIYKQDRATQPTPGFQRSRETATFVSKGLSEFMNWASSPPGTKYTKGWVSPTADELDYLAGQYFGGVSREVIKAASWVGSKFTGEEIPAYKKPIIGKLYGETASPAAVSSKFYDNVAQMAKYENEVKQRQTNKEPVEKYLKANPEARLWKDANSIENQVSKLNAEKKEHLRLGRKAQAQNVEKTKTRIMKQFNDRVTAAQ